MPIDGRDLRDIRPLQAAQASIERVRHLLWHGRAAQADQELVSFADHVGNIARSAAEPEQVVGLLSLTAGSEPHRSSGWRPDRPAFFHSHSHR